MRWKYRHWWALHAALIGEEPCICRNRDITFSILSANSRAEKQRRIDIARRQKTICICSICHLRILRYSNFRIFRCPIERHKTTITNSYKVAQLPNLCFFSDSNSQSWYWYLIYSISDLWSLWWRLSTAATRNRSLQWYTPQSAPRCLSKSSTGHLGALHSITINYPSYILFVNHLTDMCPNILLEGTSTCWTRATLGSWCTSSSKPLACLLPHHSSTAHLLVLRWASRYPLSR